MKKVIIYTDGACSMNPGPGGWASILFFNGVVKEISGGEELTTNNRMELTAPIKALEMLKEPCEVEIYSDSAYIINTFHNDWISGWIKNNWRNSRKGHVLNVEYWQKLIHLTSVHKVTWIKVKGHSDNIYNNRCDELARAEIKKIQNRKEG